MPGRKILLTAAIFTGLAMACLYSTGSYGQSRDSGGYRSGYQKAAGYYADIYYGANCETHAAATMRIIDVYYPYLAAEFGIYKDLKAEIAIHGSKEDMYAAMGKDYGEKPPMGAYYKGVIQILSPECWVQSEAVLSDEFVAEGPVIHELAHFMLEEKTGGNYEVWFSEGVALYMEYKYMAYEWKAQTESYDKIALSEMAEYFKQINQASAYRMAFEQVKNLVENYGQGVLSDIYEQLESGVPFCKVIQSY